MLHRSDRHRRARHLHRRLPHPLGQKVAEETRGQRLLAPLHGRRRLGPLDRPHPRRHRRRPLRRHERRRLQGLLLLRRTPHRAKTTLHTGADIYIWRRRQTADPDLQGRRQLLRPGRQLRPRTLEHASAPKKHCGAVAIGGGGGVSSANGTIYFLSPEQLAAPATASRTPPTSIAPAPPTPTRPTT